MRDLVQVVTKLNNCLRVPCLPNFGINSDKYPANYGVIFYGSEVISAFNFVVGYFRLELVIMILIVIF